MRALPPGPRLSPSAGIRLVLVSGAEGVKTLFTAPADVVRGGGGDSPVAAVMGPNSVIVLSGPEHMRQRKLLLPPFHGERMHDYAQVIVEPTRKDMAAWPIGEPTTFHPRSRAITLEVILRTVFGVAADRVDALHDALADFSSPRARWPCCARHGARDPSPPQRYLPSRSRPGRCAHLRGDREPP